jgi:hypothetical protein
MITLLDPAEKKKEETNLISFLKEAGCDRLQFRLLYFWSRHPRAKLSFYTCSHALHASGNLLRQAVGALVQKGILITKPNTGGLTTYALSHLESQEYIRQISILEWSSLKKIEAELESGCETAAVKQLWNICYTAQINEEE